MSMGVARGMIAVLSSRCGLTSQSCSFWLAFAALFDSLRPALLISGTNSSLRSVSMSAPPMTFIPPMSRPATCCATTGSGSFSALNLLPPGVVVAQRPRYGQPGSACAGGGHLEVAQGLEGANGAQTDW